MGTQDGRAGERTEKRLRFAVKATQRETSHRQAVKRSTKISISLSLSFLPERDVLHHGKLGLRLFAFWTRSVLYRALSIDGSADNRKAGGNESMLATFLDTLNPPQRRCKWQQMGFM